MAVFDSTLDIRFRMVNQVASAMRSASARATCCYTRFESMMMAETAEELCKRPEIGKELERATGEKRSEKIRPSGRERYWFVAHLIVLGLCAAVYFLLGEKIIPLPALG